MLYRTLPREEFDDLSSRILYEDNHLLVVNKRVGEIVQGDKTGDEPLSEKYKAFIAQRDAKPGQVFMGLPHRLDRPVSGITVLAKTSKALERLNAMFREGDVHKFYWALVCQEPPQKKEHLKCMLWRNEKQNKSYICRPGSSRHDAKSAELIYEYIGKTERYFLVEVELLTGRHHQIRAQLASRGTPLVGDGKYGSRDKGERTPALYAYRLAFTLFGRSYELRDLPMGEEYPWSLFSLTEILKIFRKTFINISIS